MKVEKLVEWNPWWESGKVDFELQGKKRSDCRELLSSIDVKEVTIITGIRRCGKSTIMYQMINRLLERGINPEKILFVNLEDKKLSQDSLDDIYAAYRKEINTGEKAYVFLDEIHKRAGWESWIRKKYDLKTNDKFVISGSCSYLLKKEYSTLLTGRNLSYEVFPLDFKEFLSFNGLEIDNKKIGRGILTEKTRIEILRYFENYLNFGGFPEILFKPENFKIKLLSQYFDDILYKDIVDRHNLNSEKAKDLALFFMNNLAGLMSLRNIRNSLGLSYDTAKDYLSYFKDAFLFFSVDHFSYSFKEQKTLPSKIYTIDGGLRNSVSFKFSKDEGKLIENLVFVELKRRGFYPYYWKNKKEVDFIVKDNNQNLIAINVSYADEIDARELEGLKEFKKEFIKTKKLVIITKDVEKVEENIEFIPIWKWLLE
ncbi:MAG: ATP-binding protein [Candidatus Micrarchaeia archaeon]